MILNENDGIKWFTDLKESIKPEYSAVKIDSVLSFYTLSGRRSTLAIENISPITDVAYTVYSDKENRYYLRQFRNYPIENLFFYRKTLTFSGDDTAIEHLQHYVEDGNVSLLLTPEQVTATTDMLKRLWKSQFTGEGQIDYRIYIQLLDQSLRLEDYKSFGSGLTGYKTLTNQFEERIRELWKSAFDKYQLTLK